MKYLIFSDVHGNLPALEAVLRDAGHVDGYISLGDVVNYGPWSNECVQRVAELNNCITIQGNHEEIFLTQDSSNCKPIATAFFEVCRKNFHQMETIRQYQKQKKFEKFILTHTIENRYIFADTQVNLTSNYMITSNGFELYNPGSVGQNRKNLTDAQYLIYDTVLDSVEYKTTQYNAQAVIDVMKKLEYPSICIEYYQSKLKGA